MIDIYTRKMYNIHKVVIERKNTMKRRLNISLDEETAEKLKELAKDSHKNMSQWITDKVWETADGQEKKENKSKISVDNNDKR